MKKSLSTLLLVLVLALAMIFTGCAKTQDAQLNFAATSNPNGLDIHQAGAHMTTEIQAQPLLMEKLDKSAYEPYIVNEYAVSDDGKTVILVFPNDLKFHTGEALLPEDVIGTFEWIKQYGTAVSTSINLVAEFESVELTAEDEDSFEITITLKAPNDLLMPFLAGNASAIIDYSYATEIGNTEFNSNPVIYGLFYITQYLRNSHVSYQRNENFKCTEITTFEVINEDGFTRYIGNDIIENRGMVDIETIKYKVISDYTLQLQQFKAGKLDAIGYIPTSYLQLFLDNEEITINYNVGFNAGYLLNPNSTAAGGALQDVKVRQAISIGLDHDDVMNRNVDSLQGFYPAYSMYAADKTANNPGVNPLVMEGLMMGDEYTKEQRYAKADELLNEAGWIIPEGGEIREKDGVKFEIKINAFSNYLFTGGAENLQQLLKNMGISAEIEALDWVSLYGKITTEEFDMCDFIPGFNDPADVINVLYTAEENRGYPCLGTVAEGDPVYDMYMAYKNSTDPEEKKQIAQEIDKYLLLDNCVLLPKQQPIEYGGCRSTLTGWKELSRSSDEQKAWDWKILNDLAFTGK